MKKIMQRSNSEGGFTLLEVIITITIAAVLASFVVAFMGTSITKSMSPVKQTRDLGALVENIEAITAAYRSYLAGGSWETFKGTCGSNCIDLEKPSGDNTYFPGVKTLKITITTAEGDQKLEAYFTE